MASSCDCTCALQNKACSALPWLLFEATQGEGMGLLRMAGPLVMINFSQPASQPASQVHAQR